MRALDAVKFLVTTGLGLALLASTTASWERDPSCVLPEPDKITALSDSWAQSLHRGDAEAATAHYSLDAILMGLGEASIRLGRSEIALHYTRFTQAGYLVEWTSREIETGCSSAMVTGTQRVTKTDVASAPPIEIAVRMSFGFGQNAWLIIHHHAEVAYRQPLPLLPPVQASPQPVAVTGSVAARPEDIAIPPQPFRLPASAPVLLPDQRLELLAAAAKPSLSIPPLTIEIGAFPAIPTNRITELSLPLPKNVPSPEQLVLPSLPRPAFPLKDVIVPPASEKRPEPPVLAPSTAQAPPQSLAAVAGDKIAPKGREQVLPKAPPPSTGFVSAAVNPVAAGRSAANNPRPLAAPPKLTSSKPTAVPMPSKASRSTVPVAAPTSMFSDFKSGRWVNGVPTFD